MVSRILLLLILTSSVCDSSDVVGHEPVQVKTGNDVILPCHLDPPFDVTNLTVEWMWNGDTVHVYRHRADVLELQDENFRGRTSLFPRELVKGNISLKLTNVRGDDAGLYICYIPRLESHVKKGSVSLVVDPQKDPAGRGDNKEPEDGDELPNNDQTGVIIGSVLSVLMLIIAVSAVIYVYYIEHWRREKNKQEDDQQREEPDTEEKKPLNKP